MKYYTSRRNSVAPMSMYQLWFKHGAKHKMNIKLLVHLLAKANMVELVEERGEKKCRLTEQSEETIYCELRKYSQLPLWSQLFVYYQAVKTWKQGPQLAHLERG